MRQANRTGCVLFLLCALSTSLAAAEDRSDGWLFFAFDNGVGRGQLQPEQQAEILAELGYQGIGYTGIDNIPAMLAALDAHRLKMVSTYIPVNIKPDEVPYDPGLPAAIKQLKAHGTALWLHIHGDRASSTALDDRAVQVIREIAEMAQAAELPVVLYPHTGFTVATTADAVRLAEKIDRDNVGASFNLCHFLKQNDEQDLKKQLEEAMPYLFLVSINGADSGQTQQMAWNRLIQTLDRGTLDVGCVLRLLKDGGYDGPIGLQCYAIPGDARKNLARSMAAWRKLNGQLE